ncbi:MAG TPA: DUF5686 family protein [Puia sp.]|nr:DUF5686 family protein [Puia sp.]
MKRIRLLTSAVLLLHLSLPGFAQTITITGTVRDAVTRQPLSGVSVYIRGSKGISTDSMGNYTIQSSREMIPLIFSIVDYRDQTIMIKKNENRSLRQLDVFLDPSTAVLKNFTVVSKKKPKYHNRDNPAVEFIRHVIENKEKNRPTHYDYLEYEKYEKLQVSLSKVSVKITNSKLFKNYRFLLQNVDTAKVEGKSLVPVYLEEKLSDDYYMRSPERTKSFVLGNKKVDYGDFIDTRGVGTFLKRFYEDIDIYANNISLFTNTFLSPISESAPAFYMYFIRDTIVDDSGRKLLQMYFTPRNTGDLLFRGTMFVTLDGTYAIQKLSMTVSKSSNLNFVRELRVEQEFIRGFDGRYNIAKSDVLAEAGISKQKGGGIFGERAISYKNYQFNLKHPDDFYNGAKEIILDNAEKQKDSFWSAHRHDTLTVAESKVYKNIDSLTGMSSYKRLLRIINLVLAGYGTFDKFEIGPAGSFYSFNPIEGFRLRFGGRTTPGLSKRIYFETYAAYGFKDEKWKGYLGVTYSLNNKSIYAYPLNYIRVSAQRETKIPGEELQFVEEDNFFLSFKRGNNDFWLYNDYYRFDYVHELPSHFSYSFGLKYWRQQPAGAIQYTKIVNSDSINIPAVTTSELSMTLRWAPNEQFYQGRVYRTPIINKYPIFTFRYGVGVKGLFGGEYNYHNLGLRIEKRFYYPQLGYTDAVFEGGYIFGQLPYPLLTIHHANQTYAYQLNSYNLMNFMEFVSDHFASATFDHHFNGFIFNRVPLLRKLKLREVVSAKFLFGALRSENDPAKNPNNPNIFQFLKNANGQPETFPLNDGPYIEGSVGVSNIFKLLRVDLVKRFSYLNPPHLITNGGIGVRALVRFDF